ncbi:MAG TPA: PepSY domain-containing protein [Sporichthya sp.]|nr:PepSY domain-containing protein [Sporichthya sp.]
MAIDSPSAVTGAPAFAPTARQRSLYRAVWRWHFYAGLFAIPVIVLLSITGIIYLFKPQLNGFLYGQYMNVKPAAQAQPYEQQRQAVLDRYPGASVDGLHTPDAKSKATEFEITRADGGTLAVWVNPYTAQITGSKGKNNLVQISREIHGTLVTGDFLTGKFAKYGDAFIEIVAGWTIVMLVTGLYLWWPRGKRRSIRAAFTIRRQRERNKRLFWRDLHAVTGVMFAFFLFAFLITGLVWTGVWGKHFSEQAAKVDGYTYGYYGEADAPSTFREQLPNGASPWLFGNLPTTSGSQTAVAAGPQVGTAANDGGRLSWAPGTPAPLDAVISNAQHELGSGSLYVIPPAADDPKASWFAGKWYDTDGKTNRSPTDLGGTYLDQYTGRVLTTVGFSDASRTAQTIEWGIALHEGRAWGIWSQLIALGGTLSLLLSVASSLVMWRKRRPRGVGSPRREPNRRIGIGIFAIVAGLGLLFPLLGLSMVFIVLLEFFLMRRVPPVARAFGLITDDRIPAGVGAGAEPAERTEEV